MGLIRFLLAISVVVFHGNHTIFGAKLMGGMLAVQMFYIISGFYMSLILNEKYVNENKSYFLFISNRFLRLFPLYYVVLIIVVLVHLVLFYKFDMISPTLQNYFTHSKNFNFTTLFYLITSQIFIFGQELALFLGMNAEAGSIYFTKNFQLSNPQVNGFMFLGQAWTVSLELMFYLIAPFIVRRNVKFVLFIAAISILIRVLLSKYLGLNYDPWTYRFLPTELIYFLLGYFAYKLYKYLSIRQLPNIYPQIGLVFLLIYTLYYGNLFGIMSQPIAHKILHLGYIVSFVVLIPLIFNYTKKNKLDAQIGDLSYPIYLSHGIFLLIGYFFQIHTPLFILGGTIITSYVLNKFVSEGIEKYRQKRLK